MVSTSLNSHLSRWISYQIVSYVTVFKLCIVITINIVQSESGRFFWFTVSQKMTKVNFASKFWYHFIIYVCVCVCVVRTSQITWGLCHKHWAEKSIQFSVLHCKTRNEWIETYPEFWIAYIYRNINIRYKDTTSPIYTNEIWLWWAIFFSKLNLICDCVLFALWTRGKLKGFKLFSSFYFYLFTWFIYLLWECFCLCL